MASDSTVANARGIDSMANRAGHGQCAVPIVAARTPSNASRRSQRQPSFHWLAEPRTDLNMQSSTSSGEQSRSSAQRCIWAR